MSMHPSSMVPGLKALASTSAVAVLLAIAPQVGASAATAKVGAKCTKVGATSGTLACTRKAGTLVWARKAATTTTRAAAAAAASTGIEGTWKATNQSVVGYRVKEVINGQSTEGVGRTSAVTGSLTIAGTSATAVALTVDMTTLKSDESRRDGQVNGRIMQTSRYPTATLKLLEPIDFGKVPADKEQVSAKAKVELTLRGVTKPVDVTLTARRNGATVEVQGSIGIVFADWGIPNPSFASITTEDNGALEFLVVFAR